MFNTPACMLYRGKFSQGSFRAHSLETNLGVLESTLTDGTRLDRDALQMALSHEVYHPDMRFDSGAGTASLLVLILVAAIASDRILGLTRLWFTAVRHWQESRAYAERTKILEVRRRLEGQFGSDDDDFGMEKDDD